MFLRVQKIVPYTHGMEMPLEFTLAVGLHLENDDYTDWDALNNQMGLNAPTDTKKDAYQEFIRTRLNKMGFYYPVFLIKKAFSIIEKGTFRYAETPLPPVITVLTNIIWFLILFLFIFALCPLPNTRHTPSSLFIALVPLMLLFTLLFTQGQSRYLINHLPLICVIASHALTRLYSAIFRKQPRENPWYPV